MTPNYGTLDAGGEPTAAQTRAHDAFMRKLRADVLVRE